MKCATCQGIGSGLFYGMKINCPVCDGAGTVPEPVRLRLYWTTWDAEGNIITDSNGWVTGFTRRLAIENATRRILASASESGRTPVSWRIGEVHTAIRDLPSNAAPDTAQLRETLDEMVTCAREAGRRNDHSDQFYQFVKREGIARERVLTLYQSALTTSPAEVPQ